VTVIKDEEKNKHFFSKKTRALMQIQKLIRPELYELFHYFSKEGQMFL
jgi:hypothetical protein